MRIGSLVQGRSFNAGTGLELGKDLDATVGISGHSQAGTFEIKVQRVLGGNLFVDA